MRAIFPKATLITLLLTAWNVTSGQSVVLNKSLPLRGGTVIREKREIRVDDGRSKLVNAQETTEVTTRYVQRLQFVRRIAGPGVEEVRVAELLSEYIHFMGPLPPPNEQSSPLTSKTLRVRKSGARWDYDLSQGKPTPEERQTLSHLAFTASLLDVIPLSLGNDARKPGDTWKSSIPAPRGKAAGFIVPKDINCIFVSLDEKPDGPHAVINITGGLSLERPMGYNSHIEITFEATVVRRLADMLDVDTKMKGSYILKGEANITGIGKTDLDFNYPFTLTRTLKIEDK